MEDLGYRINEVLTYLNDNYLRTGRREGYFLSGILGLHVYTPTQVNHIGRSINQSGFAEYNPTTGKVALTQKGIEIFENYEDLLDMYRKQVQERLRLSDLNDSHPSQKPIVPITKKITRMAITISWWLISIASGITLSVIKSVPSTLFDHLVIEKKIQEYESTPPPKPPNLRSDKIKGHSKKITQEKIKKKINGDSTNEVGD